MPEPIINIDETIDFLKEIKDRLPCRVDGREVDSKKLCTNFHCPLLLYFETINIIGLHEINIQLCRLLNEAREIWEKDK